ncbi:MAG: S8 family serine peptidase, partial [Actinomycetota bacterium]
MGNRWRNGTWIVLAVVMTALSAAPAASGEDPLGASGPQPAATRDTERTGLTDGGLRALASDRAGDGMDGLAQMVNGSARVEIHHSLTVDAIEALVGEAGGTVEGHAPGLTQAAVPLDRLEELEAHSGIAFLRSPLRVDIPQALEPAAGSVQGEHVAKTKASAWLDAGWRGEGVKVGIIDAFHGPLWDQAEASGDLPAPAGSICRVNGSACDIFVADNIHGNMVAEVIHDMAPEAELYLAIAETTTDLAAVVDYFASQGVDIISRSQTALYDGPGDGTGPIASVVDSAVSQGMAWFNSAGNNGGGGGEAGTYWRGTWSDPDADGWMDFTPGDEFLGFFCAGLINGVRWDDWGASPPTDYDIYIYDEINPSPVLKAFSEDDQGAGAPPVEHIDSNCSGPDDIDFLAIHRFSEGDGSAGDTLEFMANLSRGFEYWQNPYSASGPVSDSANPGMLSVGAVDPALGTSIANYSSQGPTNDERIKPNVSAAACVATFTSDEAGLPCFNGTSSSTPVVAGAAALALEAEVVSSATGLASWLQSNATVDRGAAGPDNTFGAGELVLPAPPFHQDVTAPAWPSGSSLQAGSILHRELTLKWTPATDDVDVTGYRVYRGSTPIGDVGAATRSLHVSGLQPGTGYRFSVQAFDAAGNESTTGPSVDVTTAPDFTDVPSGDVFHDDIAWLAGAGITRGCNPPVNDRFCPDDP